MYRNYPKTISPTAGLQHIHIHARNGLRNLLSRSTKGYLYTKNGAILLINNDSVIIIFRLDGARVIAVPVLFIQNNERILFIYLYFFSPTLKRVSYVGRYAFYTGETDYRAIRRGDQSGDRNRPKFHYYCPYNTLHGIVVSPFKQ